MAHIQTPVKGFTGTVAGVDFKNGVGESDDEAAIAYFERQGYDVMPHAPKAPAKTTAKNPAAPKAPAKTTEPAPAAGTEPQADA